MSKLCVSCAGIVALGVLLTLGAARPSDPPAADAEYVGTKACKKCHFNQWKSWAETKMANCFHVLKPTAQLKPDKKAGLTSAWIAEIKASKAKSDPKIDPAKDYTKDTECLKCHTTGYGEPGGYTTPDENDKRAKRKAQQLVGVGCESCHGPGSNYVKIFEDIQDKQRPYTRQELYAAGLTKIGPEVCAKCHNPESPLVGDDYVFDYEKRKDEGTHKHIELKLRKE